MRIPQLPRTYWIALTAALTVGGATLGVWLATSGAGDETLAATEAPAVEVLPAAVTEDSPFTEWDVSEYSPPEPSTRVVPALAPTPREDAWTRLSNLDATLALADGERNVDLPQPAGLGVEMSDYERDAILAGNSVETEPELGSGSRIRVGLGGVCVGPPR